MLENQFQIGLLPEQQCSICLATTIKPVKCRGPCHKLFCLKCAAQSKCIDDRCPHRCSKPFQVQLINLPPRLVCPFKPQQCKVQIKDTKELEQHFKVCPFITVDEKNKIYYKDNYRCNKGHKLTYLPKKGMEILFGYNWCTMRFNCGSCGQSELIRTICLSCSIKEEMVLYCSGCSPIPCSRTKCPLGHNLRHRVKPSKHRYCDLCDVPAGLLGKRAHGFCPCDFDVCDICFQRLPETSNKAPLKCIPQKLWPLTLFGNENDPEDSEWTE